MESLAAEPLEVAISDVIVEQYLKPGTRVEVRGRFDGKWSRGFAVAEVLADGYRVTRLSDGSVLPVDFEWDDVRKERRQGLWWA